MASRYSRPWASRTMAPLPSTIVSWRPDNAPIDANGFHIRSEPTTETCGARPLTGPPTSSPVLGSRLALERADDLVGHPPSVKPARLRPSPFAVEGSPVHTTRIERDVAGEGGEGRPRILVCPRRAG